MIGATIYGVLAISAIQGTLGYLIFLTLGLPSPLLWGVVMFIMSMIPMAGAFIVWVPAALYLLLTGSYVKALVLTVWGVVVIGSIDNFLSPSLVGRRARLHELLIFFSVLGGLQVFGVLGLVIGPVLAAITLALIEVVRQANRPVAETKQETTVIEAQADIRENGHDGRLTARGGHAFGAADFGVDRRPQFAVFLGDMTGSYRSPLQTRIPSSH